jgi:hypothetical protein
MTQGEAVARGLRARHAMTWGWLLLVVLLMISAMIGKVVFSEEEDMTTSLVEFFRYLTNISWFLYTIFYFYSLLFFFGDQALHVLIVAGYFPVLGQSLLVFVLVNVVFEYDPGILEESIELYGVGIVVIGNSVFHGLTILVAILYGVGFSDYVYEAHRIAWLGAPWWLKAFYVAYQGFLPLLLVGAYNAMVDPHDVYGARKMDDWVGWVIAVVVLGVVCVVYGGLVIGFEREVHPVRRAARGAYDRIRGRKPIPVANRPRPSHQPPRSGPTKRKETTR